MVVGDAHMFPGFLTPVLTQLSFQSHWLLFSHASAEVRGENTQKESLPQQGYDLNHQVMRLTQTIETPRWDWSKLKVFSVNKINVTKKLNFDLGMVENIVGKGENAGYPHFLLFPQCFQKPSFFMVVKSQDCVAKG